jgi:hypothetical protein
MSNKFRIALAVTLLALTAVSAFDTASAGGFVSASTSFARASIDNPTWRTTGSWSGGEVLADFEQP